MADNTVSLESQDKALLQTLIRELERKSIDLVEQGSLGPIVTFLEGVCTPSTWPDVRKATQLCLKELGESGANLDYDFPTVLSLIRLYMHEGKQGPNFQVFCRIVETSLRKRTPNLTYLPLIFAQAQKHSAVTGMAIGLRLEFQQLRALVEGIPSIVLNCYELSPDSFIAELTPDLFEMVPYISAHEVDFYVSLIEELIGTGLLNDRFDSVSLKEIKEHFNKTVPGREIQGLEAIIKSREEREHYWKSCNIQDDIRLDKPL